jgi:hypothetical protein
MKAYSNYYEHAEECPPPSALRRDGRRGECRLASEQAAAMPSISRRSAALQRPGRWNDVSHVADTRCSYLPIGNSPGAMRLSFLRWPDFLIHVTNGGIG